MPKKLKLHTHFTKSSKRENIYKLCLWMLEEHTCFILTPSVFLYMLRYKAHATNVNLSYIAQNH